MQPQFDGRMGYVALYSLSRGTQAVFIKATSNWPRDLVFDIYNLSSITEVQRYLFRLESASGMGLGPFRQSL